MRGWVRRSRGGFAAGRPRVAAAVVTTPDGQPLCFTVSIGLTEHRPHESVDAMLERADRAMYHAKSQGRNRVVTLLETTVAA